MAILSVFGFLSACEGTGKDADTGTDSGPVDDTADSGETGGTGDCTVTASGELLDAMPTFADVTWDGPAGATVTILATADGIPGRVYPTTEPGHHVVAFLDANREWTLQVHAESGGASCDSAPIALRTPPATSGLPTLIPSQSPDADTVPLLSASISGALGGAAVIDPAGDYVWWMEVEPGYNIDRARVSSDGTGMWLLKRSGNDGYVPELLHYPWVGEIDERIQIPNGHHDFVELNVHGDRMAWLSAEHRDVDGTSVVGDRISVMDDSGNVREVWNAFDHLTVAENIGWTDSTYQGEADWTHANTLVYVPDQDAFIIALHFIPCIVMVSRQTGETLWIFGSGPGVESDFTFADGGPGEMHSPSLTDAGLMLFENGDTTLRHTTITEFDVDWSARTASRAWTAAPSDDAYAYVLGDARRLPNGRTISTWGSLGVLEEFDADANPTWKMNLPMGEGVGFLDLPAAPWSPLP